MHKIVSRHFDFINHLLARRYRSVLIFLVLMIILPGFFEDTIYKNFSFFILNSITIFLSIYAIHENKKQLQIGFAIAFLVILINQFGIFKNVATFNFYFSFVIYLVFYAYVAYRLLKMIMASENVRIGVLYASVIVYILIGVVGGYLFMLIENASPGSIQNLKLENITNPSDFFYFSFTTLSTLGYGDINPISASA
ncbi:MAG: ion channel, partial [Saprospiraceae bacterium]